MHSFLVVMIALPVAVACSQARAPRPPPTRTASDRGTLRTGSQPTWVGSDEAVFITQSGMHAARQGAQGEAGTDSLELGSSLSPTDYARLSITRSFFVSAGAAGNLLNASLNYSNAGTRTTVDLEDMNGDGIADVLTPQGVVRGQLPDPRGLRPLVPPVPSDMSAGNAFRRHVGTTYSVGVGVSPTVNDTSSSGRPLSAATRMPSASVGGGLAIGRNALIDDLRDINADGLPDRVRRAHGVLEVQYNLGNHFGQWERFGGRSIPDGIDAFSEVEPVSWDGADPNALRHDTTVTASLNFGVATDLADFGVSIGFNASETRTVSDLVDLNGDGLLDLVFKRESDDDIQVQYNRGSDFAPPVLWSTPGWGAHLRSTDALAHATSLLGGAARTRLNDVSGPDVLSGTGRFHLLAVPTSFDIGAYFTVSIPIVPVWTLFYLIINPGFNVGEEVDTYDLALLDINGDGSAEHVLRRAGSQEVWVKRNQQTGQANLLERVHRPLGGTITLEYARTANTVDSPASRQVLTQVTVDDGVDLGAAFASPNLLTRYSYRDGYFDRHEKELFGFAEVKSLRPDGVSVTRTFENKNFSLRGSLLRETLQDGQDRVYLETTNTWSLLPARDAQDQVIAVDPDCLLALHALLPDHACTSLYPALARTSTRRFEGGSLGKERVLEDLAFDPFGNVLVSTDSGDDTRSEDDLTVTASYTRAIDDWIVELPETLVVRAGGGSILRARGAEYDARGNLAALHIQTGSGTATTVFTYDPFGNLLTVTTPPNHAGETQRYTYAYDDVAHQYAVAVEDSFGYRSTQVTDLRFGVPTATTDTNGQTITRAYDELGRLTQVHGPYDHGGPALAMQYFAGEALPRAVTQNRASPPSDYDGPVPPPITTVTVIDGLGRTLEVRKTASVAGQSGMSTQGPPR
ncbi:MAG: toxin TcdB middle/N-terminal domain-containing protein, partial [Actinomycetota bacterium]